MDTVFLDIVGVIFIDCLSSLFTSDQYLTLLLNLKVLWVTLEPSKLNKKMLFLQKSALSILLIQKLKVFTNANILLKI